MWTLVGKEGNLTFEEVFEAMKEDENMNAVISNWF